MKSVAGTAVHTLLKCGSGSGPGKPKWRPDKRKEENSE
jgi:hypothetical protein